MNFDHFIASISEISKTIAGGKEAQYKLVPKIRKQQLKSVYAANTAKKAAVLALFYPNSENETLFLLTKRASYKGVHSAQISFPGGKFDINDLNLESTALRETFEETGVSLKSISIFKEMTEVYIPPSNFLVTPFLGISKKPLDFKKNHEVEEIIQVSLKDLLSTKSISETIISTSYAKNLKVPCFMLNDYIVWGATAMMLSEIRELLKKV